MYVKKLLVITIMMSLLILLSSSSFFLTNYLALQIKGNKYSPEQFAYALKVDHIEALLIQERGAKLGSNDWLVLNQKLAKTQKDSAVKLATWFQQQAKEKSDSANLFNSILWFEQAIRLDSPYAIVQLAQLYFDQGDLVKAKNTLALFHHNHDAAGLIEDSLLLQINIETHLGNIAIVEQLINTDAFINHASEKSNRLLSSLVKYQVIKANASKIPTVKKLSEQRLELSGDCISSLQLFTSNLAFLKHLEHLIEQFKSQHVLAKYICLPIPKYINAALFDCQAEPGDAITCEESLWQHVASETKTRHVGLMLNTGGANVHQGMMYFDRQDDVNVFSHEISHLLGFVDEYPLVKTHDKCQGPQQSAFSHNIVVLKEFYQGEPKVLRAEILKHVPWAENIKRSTPVLQRVLVKTKKVTLPKQGTWRLGTPSGFKEEVGLHISESCQNSTALINSQVSFSAFKPVSQQTHLRYYSNKFPQEYLDLLEKKPLSFLMPSFHYNIALSLLQEGKTEEAREFFRQAARWDDNPKRKRVVSNGGFL